MLLPQNSFNSIAHRRTLCNRGIDVGSPNSPADESGALRRPLPLFGGIGDNEDERTVLLRVLDALRTSTVEEQQSRLTQMISQLQYLKRNLAVDDSLSVHKRFGSAVSVVLFSSHDLTVN
jgi:hypothetical protein